MAVAQRGAANHVLETINRVVNFTEAEEQIAATYSQGGRPACRVGVLLRVMILQHLYGLSDPQAEEQLKDRLSFQKFEQLEARGYIVKRTTLVDATLVESSRKRPDAQAARTGQAPDADARYTRKYT